MVDPPFRGWLFRADVARLLGITRDSLRHYISRHEGFPKPDYRADDGRVHLWRMSTIRSWQQNRPGRGVGGGFHAHRSQRPVSTEEGDVLGVSDDD